MIVIAIVLIGLVAYAAGKEAVRNRNIERDVEKMRSQAEQIRTENKDLSRKIAYYETKEFQEKIAKEKMNLKKPGEEVVMVKINDEDGTDEGAGAAQTNSDNKGQQMPNYLIWWRKIMHI